MNETATHAASSPGIRDVGAQVFSPYLADLFVVSRRSVASSAANALPNRQPILETRIKGCDFAFSLGPYLRESNRHLYSVILREYKPRELLGLAPELRPHTALLGNLLYRGLTSLHECGEFSLIAPIPPKLQELWEHYHLEALMRALEASLSSVQSQGFWAIQRETLRFAKRVPTIKTIPLKQRFLAVHGMMESVEVENASVLIVDDILASGATLVEAARALKVGGARRVAAITLAKRVR